VKVCKFNQQKDSLKKWELKMIRKYKNTKPRLKGWDYSWPGDYFITLVTHNMNCIFGEIKDKQMICSPLGEIVKEEWLRSFEIRSELVCKCWVIMPNHIHAILTIVRNPTTGISEIKNAEPQKTGVAYRPPRSISSFVAGFKSAATKRINQYRNTPDAMIWQERFHDHIIRDDAGYHKIKHYIENNPRTWDDDRFHYQ
jgi:putative transposase